jgi:hypothetical protein
VRVCCPTAWGLPVGETTVSGGVVRQPDSDSTNTNEQIDTNIDGFLVKILYDTG